MFNLLLDADDEILTGRKAINVAADGLATEAFYESVKEPSGIPDCILASIAYEDHACTSAEFSLQLKL